MLVSELVQLLKTMPQDAPILDCFGMEIDGAHIEPGWRMEGIANSHPVAEITVVQLESY